MKLSEIDDNREIVKEKSLNKYKKIKEKGGKIDIVRFSQEDTTIYDIKNWIARQEKKFGYKYDMIVLDYLDCLEPNKKEKELLSAELQIIKSFEADVLSEIILIFGRNCKTSGTGSLQITVTSFSSFLVACRWSGVR